MATQVAVIPAKDSLGLALKAGIGVLVIALVAVVAGTAHEAYLNLFFPGAKPKPYSAIAALESALRSGETPRAAAMAKWFMAFSNERWQLRSSTGRRSAS